MPPNYFVACYIVQYSTVCCNTKNAVEVNYILYLKSSRHSFLIVFTHNLYLPTFMTDISDAGDVGIPWASD